MYTFIRIPKSGSTSMMASISQVYPYSDNRHLTVSEILEDGKDHKFYTVIRDPLQQYCSMYYFLKNREDEVYNPDNFMLIPFVEHMDIIKQTNSLNEYLVNCPENAFLGKYLSGISPLNLESIGHLDHMDDTRKIFNIMLKLPIAPVWLKKNPCVNGRYFVEKNIIIKFLKRNELEYDLYRQGYEYFNNLRKSYLS